jgi:hypothetical protein
MQMIKARRFSPVVIFIFVGRLITTLCLVTSLVRRDICAQLLGLVCLDDPNALPA